MKSYLTEMDYVQHLRHCLPSGKWSWTDDSHFYFPNSLASRILHGKSFSSNLKPPQTLLNEPQWNLTFSVSLTGKENFNALKATKIF